MIEWLPKDDECRTVTYLIFTIGIVAISPIIGHYIVEYNKIGDPNLQIKLECLERQFNSKNGSITEHGKCKAYKQFLDLSK